MTDTSWFEDGFGLKDSGSDQPFAGKQKRIILTIVVTISLHYVDRI